jgi:hypothetical protein
MPRLTGPLSVQDEDKFEDYDSRVNIHLSEDRTMRRTVTAMLAALLLLSAVPAADEPAAPNEQLEALKNELEKGRTEYSQAYEKAKTNKQREDIRVKEDKRRQSCAQRALELAQKHPTDPAAVDALSWIIAGGLGWNGAGAEIETAFELLRKDYVTSDKLQRVCEIAFAYDSVSTKPEEFLRAVLEKNPQRDLRGQACYSLGEVLRRHAVQAKGWREIKDNPAKVKMIETYASAAVIKRIKTGDPDKSLQEAERLFERTISEYGDVKKSNGRALADIAKATLFEMNHLVVGKAAPEIEGEDIDGKRFKLSDYRGKVVVLDFWGHW